MSPEIKQTFGVVSGLRPSPYYESTGIPIPPRKTKCLGESCPVQKSVGRCFEDTHHLLFTEKFYSSIGGIYRELQKDPFMKLDMARCRHNSKYHHAMHTQFDFTPLPSREAAFYFLEESRLLRRLDSSVKVLHTQLNPYFSNSLRKRNRATQESVIAKKAVIIEQSRFVMEQCVSQVNDLEVVPSRIFGSFLQRVNEDRLLLQERTVDERVPREIQEILLN